MEYRAYSFQKMYFGTGAFSDHYKNLLLKEGINPEDVLKINPWTP